MHTHASRKCWKDRCRRPFLTPLPRCQSNLKPSTDYEVHQAVNNIPRTRTSCPRFCDDYLYHYTDIMAVQPSELKNNKFQPIVARATLKCVAELCFFTRWLPFHPFLWDKRLNAPVVAGNLSFWRWHVLSGIAFYMLLLIRVVQVTVIKPGSVFEQMFVLFMASYFSLFVVLQIHAVLYRDRTVSWMQGFFLFTKRCEGNISARPVTLDLSRRTI